MLLLTLSMEVMLHQEGKVATTSTTKQFKGHPLGLEKALLLLLPKATSKNTHSSKADDDWVYRELTNYKTDESFVL